MSRARRKLEEAEFFLERLRENYGKVKKFDWYLSAFISSSRSVTWVVRSEYSRVPGWRDWWKELGKATDADEISLLKGTNMVRIRTEKREPLHTDTKVVAKQIRVPKEQVERFRAFMERVRDQKVVVSLAGTMGKDAVLQMTAGDETFAYPVAEVLMDRRLPELPDTDILQICERYYAALASVVGACEQKFGVPKERARRPKG
jgi:hypothetical protein